MEETPAGVQVKYLQTQSAGMNSGEMHEWMKEWMNRLERMYEQGMLEWRQNKGRIYEMNGVLGHNSAL